MQQCRVMQPVKQGVGQEEALLIHVTATAFGLLSMLNAVNKTPNSLGVLYILILQGYVNIASLKVITWEDISQFCIIGGSL